MGSKGATPLVIKFVTGKIHQFKDDGPIYNVHVGFSVVGFEDWRVRLIILSVI